MNELKICKVCGKEYFSTALHTCSIECRELFRQTLVTRKCKKCGVDLIVKYGNNKPTCQKCKDKTSFKEIKVYRFKIFERDDFKCVYCGKSSIEHGIELMIEHVMPKYNKENNKILNLVTACKKCNFQKGVRYLDKAVVDRIIERNKKLLNKYPDDLVSKMEKCFYEYYKDNLNWLFRS